MVSNKVLVGVGTVGAVAAIALAGSSAVFAQSENGQNGLAQRIATKFNLNQDEVQAVIQEDRDARHEEHLNQLVADGKITEEQKTLLQEKHKEMAAQRQQDQSLMQEQRQQKREQNRAEMEAWAEENGIDLESLRPDDAPKGDGGGRGMHRGGMM